MASRGHNRLLLEQVAGDRIALWSLGFSGLEN